MWLVHGNQHGDLLPRALINREQKAVIAYRYIDVFDLWEYFEHEYGIGMALFNDNNEMSHWARIPIERLRLRFVASARYRRFFMPQESVSRAEALQILIRVGSAVYDLEHPIMLR